MLAVSKLNSNLSDWLLERLSQMFTGLVAAVNFSASSPTANFLCQRRVYSF